jgi:hypothetical protein
VPLSAFVASITNPGVVDGGITFLLNDVHLGVDNTSPYAWDISPATLGHPDAQSQVEFGRGAERAGSHPHGGPDGPAPGGGGAYTTAVTGYDIMGRPTGTPAQPDHRAVPK